MKKPPSNIIPFVVPTEEDQEEDNRMFPGGFWKCFWQYRKDHPPKFSYRAWLRKERERNAKFDKGFAFVSFGLLFVVILYRLIIG